MGIKQGSITNMGNKNFRIFLKKFFNTPSFKVGDKVIVWPDRIKGTVTKVDCNSSGWSYFVVFTKPRAVGYQNQWGWWESSRSLTTPYVEDLMRWE